MDVPIDIIAISANKLLQIKTVIRAQIVSASLLSLQLLIIQYSTVISISLTQFRQYSYNYSLTFKFKNLCIQLYLINICDRTASTCT